MHWLDYVVLLAYFGVMAGVGLWIMRSVKAQEDYFMGGRTFGKLLQTFAAFGAGTGSSDPVNAGRTTFTDGMSGMWSVMYWLFVTPFYWITAVWYRRMRHLTLGDWFQERYESRSLAAGYAVFGIVFYMYYGSMMFSAIGKVAAPLVGSGNLLLNGQSIGIEYVLVPLIGIVVLVYGALGGLRAAYVTDLIQGLCIILLSVLLIPFSIHALLERFGDPAAASGVTDAFRILHQRLPPDAFAIVGSTSSSEFPLYRIVAVVIINLVTIVIQPHFIATGGGSAKTETTARVGLVVGNFLKRLCTVGWVVTALFALALFADMPELAEDPDKTWGVASRELLGPGLSGLMLACLLAALMSSIDAYMIVGSALVVRNIYAPLINPNATEREYLTMARLTGALIVTGAVIVSLRYMDVFAQLQLTWVIGVLFAAPFWVGIYWRRATPAAAWGTVIFCTLAFFVLPAAVPAVFPSLRESPALAVRNEMVRTVSTRPAAHSDVAKRQGAISLWDSYQSRSVELAEAVEQTETEAMRQVHIDEQQMVQASLARLGARPAPISLGEPFVVTRVTGGKSVFWSDGVQAVSGSAEPIALDVPESLPTSPNGTETTRQRLGSPADTQWQGNGSLRLDFFLYAMLGVELTSVSDAMLNTLELPTKIVLPFVVMIVLSWLTKPNSAAALDRYYAKMRTPVDPDPEMDVRKLNTALANPDQCERRQLFPGTNLEFQRPTFVDVAGFVGCFVVCFAIVGLAVWVAQLGV